MSDTQVSLIEKYSCRAIVGGRGSGKTTFMLGDQQKQIWGLRHLYYCQYGMNVLFIDTNPDRPEPPDYLKIPIIDWKKIHLMEKGYARVIVSGNDADECFQYLVDKKIKEKLFVVEDSAKIIPQKIDTHPVRSLMIDSKSNHNSLTFMYHMWTDLPPRMLGLLDQYVIFKSTADTPAARGIKNTDVLEAHRRVMNNKTSYFHEVVKQGA